MNLLVYCVIALTSFGICDLPQQAKQSRECDFSESGRVIRMSGVTPAIKKVKPDYPGFAKAAKIEGRVVAAVLLDRKGEVLPACAISGHPLLRDAAIQAALQWKFKDWL